MKKKLTLSLILTFLMLYSLAVTISASEMHNTTTTTINMVRETAIGKVQMMQSKSSGRAIGSNGPDTVIQAVEKRLPLQRCLGPGAGYDGRHITSRSGPIN